MANHPLAVIPLFAELSDAELAELETALQESRYSDHQPVVWVGDPGEDFFLIRSGHVEISCPDETGKEVALGTLSPGQFFGEISLLDGGPRTATVRARGDVVLSRLSRERFLEFLRGHPDAAVHMMTVLGRRQRETVEKVRGIRNVNEAVARQLTHWQVVAERIASVTATKWFVSLNLGFFVFWILLNLLLRHWRHAFDGPHFDLLGLLVTIEALFIALFVLISQNQQNERDRIRADLDYQVNLKAHQEVMQLHQKVDRLTEVIQELTAGNPAADNPVPGRATEGQLPEQPLETLLSGQAALGPVGRKVALRSVSSIPLTGPAASE
jgi:CRP/FNR family cyclic AMP-dependent transcriptional regulator